eukprot:COSAG06_NODE_820_length_12102_cov_16.846205_2_plen_84_part_00
MDSPDTRVESTSAAEDANEDQPAAAGLTLPKTGKTAGKKSKSDKQQLVPPSLPVPANPSKPAEKETRALDAKPANFPGGGFAL